jgi:hypothetical protein
MNVNRPAILAISVILTLTAPIIGGCAGSSGAPHFTSEETNFLKIMHAPVWPNLGLSDAQLVNQGHAICDDLANRNRAGESPIAAVTNVWDDVQQHNHSWDLNVVRGIVSAANDKLCPGT